MIHIVNKRTYKRDPSHQYFAIDRTSPVGNPFFMKTEAERNKVCDEYEIYFNDIVTNNLNNEHYRYLANNYPDIADQFHGAPFMNYLALIILAAQKGDVYLGCWCTPKRCHGETIKRFVESTLVMEGPDGVYYVTPRDIEKTIKICFK